MIEPCCLNAELSKMNFHFIAIGGAVMHNLAIALHKKGYTVSGSDDEIFEPSYSRLEAHGLLPDKQGWDPDRIHTGLDAVILGMHARKTNPELKKALDMITSGHFSLAEPHLFKGIVESLLDGGDWYMVLVDYQAYIESQEAASRMYHDRDEWTRRSILYTANMGKFSSDRSILEYARDIWNVEPTH